MMDQSKEIREGMVPTSLEEGQDALDTALKILYRNLLQYGDRVAMRKKRFGVWQEYSWKDVYEHVKNLLGIPLDGRKERRAGDHYRE
jgi:long-subunit acyl-CoA synthetase (AMP-forming)